MSRASSDLIVVGAGYAGVLAANRLAGKLPAARVRLISPAAVLVDRIRLHEAAARGRLVERPLRDLLHRRVEHVPGLLRGLDAERRELVVSAPERSASAAGDQRLRFDAAVLALGSRPAPGLDATGPHLYALADQRRAHALHRELCSRASGRVAVVGGGLTAVELAAELAEAHRGWSVELVTRELTPGLGAASREVRAALVALGVRLREGARVIAVDQAGPRLASGERVAADLTVLAAGLAPAEVVPGLGLALAPDGRLAVDGCLRALGHESLFAVGDCAAPPAAAVGAGAATSRMACATAMPQAAHAADCIERVLAGRAPVEYSFSYAMQCLSLGRRRGLVARVDPDDVPTGRVLGGRRAALAKELVCRLVVGALRLERLVPGLYTWPGRRRRSALAAARAAGST